MAWHFKETDPWLRIRSDSRISLHTTQSAPDRKSTRLNSSHSQISYAVFCLKKKNNASRPSTQTDHRPCLSHPQLGLRYCLQYRPAPLHRELSSRDDSLHFYVSTH